MTLRRPSNADLFDIGERYHLHLTEDEFDVMAELVGAVMGGYDELEQYPDPLREVIPAVRVPGARPGPEEDPCNGVVRACSVKALGGGDGLLAGKRIGIKDTVCIAGIPISIRGSGSRA